MQTNGKLKKDWNIIGLGADEPFPELKEKLSLFGQFIGDWDIIEARYPQPDGTEIKRTGGSSFRLDSGRKSNSRRLDVT